MDGMECISCGSAATSGEVLCSPECAGEAERELVLNQTRLGELRRRPGKPPCAEAHGLMDRNSQLQDALRQVGRLARA